MTAVSNRLRTITHTTSHELTFYTQTGEVLASQKVIRKKHTFTTTATTFENITKDGAITPTTVNGLPGMISPVCPPSGGHADARMGSLSRPWARL